MMDTQELSKRLLEVLTPIVQNLRSEARMAIGGKVTMPQFRILSNIRQGFSTVGALADNQGVAQPTTSKMVDGLVKRGLVKRIFGKTDRRQTFLELTKKGEAVRAQAHKAVANRIAKNLTALSTAQRVMLMSALDGLEATMVQKQALSKTA